MPQALPDSGDYYTPPFPTTPSPFPGGGGFTPTEAQPYHNPSVNPAPTPPPPAPNPTPPPVSAPPRVNPPNPTNTNPLAPYGPATMNIAGYTPDYDALIRNDPAYLSAQSGAVAAQQKAEAARRASVRDAFVKFGGKMPSGWTDQYGDIDQATMDAAAGNQFSTEAGIGRNYSQSLDQFKRALAARGMLQSGELNYGQNQLDVNRGQSEYDAANVFTGQYNQDVSGYAGVLAQNARDITQGIIGATGNVYQNPAYRPKLAVTADYDAGESAKRGQAIYAGPDGQLYTGDGRPIAAANPGNDYSPVNGGGADPVTGIAPWPTGNTYGV